MTVLAYQKQFEALLPQLKEAAGFAFRKRSPADREEAIADVCAAAWSAWHGLIKRGKNPIEVGPTGILTNAIRYVRNGRRVGNPGLRSRSDGSLALEGPEARRVQDRQPGVGPAGR